MLTTATVRVEINRQLTDIDIEGEVLSALQSVGTSRQGACPRGRNTPHAMSELQRLGLIGDGGGLTRRGSYAYLDVQEQVEAELGW